MWFEGFTGIIAWLVRQQVDLLQNVYDTNYSARQVAMAFFVHIMISINWRHVRYIFCEALSRYSRVKLPQAYTHVAKHIVFNNIML